MSGTWLGNLFSLTSQTWQNLWHETAKHFGKGQISVADYTILWPFPTESLTAQEKSGEPSLQASLHSLAVRRLISAKLRCFSCSYGSTGQFTDVARLLVG